MTSPAKQKGAHLPPIALTTEGEKPYYLWASPPRQFGNQEAILHFRWVRQVSGGPREER